MSFYDAETRACREDAARSMGQGLLDRACMRAPRVPLRGGQRHGGPSGLTDQPDPGLVGLTNLSTSSYMLTPSGGGEPGVATGFGIVYLVQHGFTASGRYGGGWNGVQGYTLDIIGNTYRCQMADASNTQRTVDVVLSNSDIGKLVVICFFYDGTTMVAETHRGELSKSLAITGYAPVTSGRRINFGGDGTATYSGAVLSSCAYRGTPSAAQRKAFYDQTRVRGDFPDTMEGATITRRASVRDELRGVSNPAGRKTYGARGFSVGNYLGAAATKGILGATNALTVQALLMPGAGGCAVATLTATTGYQLVVSPTAISFSLYDGAGVVQTATYTIANQQTPTVVTVTWDGTNVRLYRADVLGSTTPVTGFLPGTTAMRIGERPGPSTAPYTGSVFAVQGGDFVASLADIQASVAESYITGRLGALPGAQHLYDLTRDVMASGNLSAVPATVLDRIGTDHLTRTGTLELAIDTATAPAAPAQLTDTITRATADALLRVGNPSVKIIDPSVDGRRVLGAQGFSANNWLQSATDVGLLGAAGQPYWFAIGLTLDSLTAVANACVASQSTTGGNGWELNWQSATILRMMHGGVGFSSGITMTAADLGAPMMVLVEYTGTVLRMYARGVQVGSDLAIGYAPSTGSRLKLGMGYSSAFLNGSISSFECGLSSLTLAQITQAFSDFAATGKVQSIAGATTHRYDLTTDILASGVDAVPAQVLDRVGTDHLTRVGGAEVATLPANARGLRNLGASGFYTTPDGIPGVASAAWWTAVAVVPENQNTSVSDIIVGRQNNPGNSGWTFVADANNAAYRIGVSSGAGFAYAPIAPIAPGDLGVPQLAVIRHTGTTVELWYKGARIGSPAAVSAFTPAATSFSVGFRTSDSVGAVDTNTFLGVSGGHAAISDAEIAQMYVDFAADSRVPRVPGKTLRRFDAVQDAIDNGGVLPVRLVDRESSGDVMTRAGSGLTLAQRTERVWSYEPAPVANGFLMPATFTDGFEAANVQIGTTTGSWWITAVVQHFATNSGGKRFLHRSSGATGFLGLSLNGTAYQLQAANGATMTSAPTAIIAAADLGKTAVLTLMWDATTQKLRTFYKRAEVGSGISFASGYTPDTGNLCWGAIRGTGGSPQSDANQLGLAGGNFLLSLAEIYAQHDAIVATDGVIQAVPGKTAHLWNGRRLAGVTAFVPGVTTIPDEIGASPFVMANIIGITTGIARADVYSRAMAA